MKTSHAAKRRGDRRRRLDAVVLARGHDGEHRVGLRLLGLAAQRLPHVLQRLVDDHENVLPGRHREAAAHDGADGAGETGHGSDATRRSLRPSRPGTPVGRPLLDGSPLARRRGTRLGSADGRVDRRRQQRHGLAAGRLVARSAAARSGGSSSAWKRSLHARDEPVTVIFDGRAHDAGGGSRVAVRSPGARARRRRRRRRRTGRAPSGPCLADRGDVRRRARRRGCARRRRGRRRRGLPAPARRRRVAKPLGGRRGARPLTRVRSPCRPDARVRAVQLTELVAPPTEGRVFTDRARAGLGDVAPSGRVRLDTIARWLQDAAFADLLDSGAARRRRVDRAAPAPARRALPADARARLGGDVVQRRREPRGRAAQHRARRRRRARRSRGAVGAPRSGRRAPASDARGLRGRLRRRRRRGVACGARLRHRGEPPADGAVALRGASAPPTSTSPTTSTTPSTGRRSRRTSPATAPASRSTRRSSTAPRPTSARPRIVRDGEMLWITAADGEVLASLATPGGPTVRTEISTSA